MLMRAVDSYLAVRRAAGFKLHVVEVLLRSFAHYAEELGEQFVRSQTAIDWAARTKTPGQKKRRLLVVVRFARYIMAEDSRHEIPPESFFGHHSYQRPNPFIFKGSDIVRLIAQAQRIDPVDSLFPHTLSTLFALLASTGLRSSEALALRLDDVTADGLMIRETKFHKSRLVPLHESAVSGLGRYLAVRRRTAAAHDHLFISPRGGALRYEYVRKTFRRLVSDIGLDRSSKPRPQLHSFRHTFAVRALESCPHDRDRIALHMLALSTYLGHAHLADTYWYLEATPQQLKDIALLGERFVKGDQP